MEISKKFSTLCTFGLLSDRNITSKEKEVYLYVKFRYQLFKTRGESFRESTLTMANFFGVNEKTIRRSLKSLVDNGYLEAKDVKGKPTEYRLTEIEKWTDPGH